jgi:hypothetical protein
LAVLLIWQFKQFRKVCPLAVLANWASPQTISLAFVLVTLPHTLEHCCCGTARRALLDETKKKTARAEALEKKIEGRMVERIDGK